MLTFAQHCPPVQQKTNTLLAQRSTGQSATINQSASSNTHTLSEGRMHLDKRLLCAGALCFGVRSKGVTQITDGFMTGLRQGLGHLRPR